MVNNQQPSYLQFYADGECVDMGRHDVRLCTTGPGKWRQWFVVSPWHSAVMASVFTNDCISSVPGSTFEVCLKYYVRYILRL